MKEFKMTDARTKFKGIILAFSDNVIQIALNDDI